jgi:selenophosphate synthetase-related protein
MQRTKEQMKREQDAIAMGGEPGSFVDWLKTENAKKEAVKPLIRKCK